MMRMEPEPTSSYTTQFSEILLAMDERLDALQLTSASGFDTLSKCVTNFCRESHWHKLELACQAVSKECTKLAVAFSKDPEPSNEHTHRLLHDVNLAVDVLQAWTLALPFTEGKMLLHGLLKLVHSIVSEVKDFLLSVQEDKCSSNSRRLTSTGTVWEKCDQIKTIPRDNCVAFQKENEAALDMVSDAFEELETAIKEEGFTSDSEDEDAGLWRERDKKILQPSLGLIKACRNCLKKTLHAVQHKGSCSSADHINEFDKIGETLTDISPFVDDFALSLYPPLTSLKVKTEIDKLHDKASSLIELVREAHFTNDSDLKWIDIIANAIHHNHAKVFALLPVVESG